MKPLVGITPGRESLQGRLWGGVANRGVSGAAPRACPETG